MKNPFSNKPKPKYDIYIAFGGSCRKLGETERGCMWYESRRAAAGYEVSIREGPYLQTVDYMTEDSGFITTLTKEQGADFKEYVRIMEPKRCQDWVMDILTHLEANGVIGKDVLAQYQARYEKSSRC
ncbi:hypothetical protein BJY00DRAFT_313184 [Aspergillus carlsbadensis]|nr:hypothetical protein BJY00DRAFT_313184 [Aspergillus carlsbadensis]